MTVTIPEPQVSLPAVLDPRVVRGAELLDERMPGWAERIDLDILSIECAHNCVLGQAVGFCAGLQLLGFVGPHEADAANHGFVVLHDFPDDVATQDWRLAILARRT